MRVNSTNVPNTQSAQTEQLKKSDAPAKSLRKDAAEKFQKTAISNESARADISAKGKDFAAAHAVAKSAPDIREDRIADLKKRIAEGKYEVDANKLADKLVNEHMNF